MIVQASQMPPPVVVGPSGLPASVCTGLPEIIQNGVRYCVFGVRVIGDAYRLGKARDSLVSTGWDAKVSQISPSQRVMIIDAVGKDLKAVSDLQRRFSSGEFGALEATVVSIPVPAQRR